jgi:RNase P/RNase MRP subunit p30
MQRKYLAIDLRGYPSELFETVCQVTPVENFSPGKGINGVEVAAPHQLKMLPRADVVFARGGTARKNRIFLRSKKVDVLACPYPFDSVQARLAAENSIALELSFREIRCTAGYMRARILDRLRTTILLAKKYHARLIITSGACCEEAVVSPRQLVAFGKVVGLTYPEAKASLYTIPKRVVEGVE